MAVEDAKRRIESGAEALRGQCLSRVRYAAISYEDGAPHWDYGSFHNPELGFELTLISGAVLKVGWGWEFCHYGLTFSGPDEPELWTNDTQMWDVSDEPHWARLLQTRISSVLVYWHHSVDDDAPSPYYPQDLEIAFASDRRVWALAAQYNVGTGRFWGASDEVIVAFDEHVVREHSFGGYAPINRLHHIGGA